MQKPLVGISSCLMGYKVRYDGKDKFNQIIHDQIAPHVNLLPLCPEASVGMGIPRPPIQLIKTEQRIEALGRDDRSLIVTDKLLHFGATITKVHQQLSGFILQSRSPSCGVGTTPIFNENGDQIGLGNGLFAQQLIANLPELPLISDGDVSDSQAVMEFLDQVRQYHSR